METGNQNNNPTPVNYSIPVAIVLAGIIIAGAMYFSNSTRQDDSSAAAEANQGAAISVEKIKTDGEPFVGDPNAPVTMIMWFDYQCPACQYGEANLIAPLVADYVKAGKLKIVFKDFAFLSADSQTLAQTARAVWEAYPDKFYEWHKVIFANQGQERTGWATKAVIDNLTQKVGGIDQTVIDGLLTKNAAAYQAEIDADKAEGAKFGVNATPSILIGETLQKGVPSYASVKILIDSLLE